MKKNPINKPKIILPKTFNTRFEPKDGILTFTNSKTCSECKKR